MDHSDLIKEMPRVEQLPTQERLMLARRQRLQQLKLWSQKEKEYSRRPPKRIKSEKPNITFNNSVVLIESASRNDIDEVRNLLMKGVNADSCNEDGLTALHQCCIDNNQAMLLLLLEYGANINAEDSEKWTPLHAAATCGHLDLVRILIARGGNLLAVNADGNMPYDICEDDTALDFIESEMAKRGVTQKLIDDTRARTEIQMLDDMQRRANHELEYHDAQGATPLHIAAANGYIAVAEFLLNRGVSTDVKDNDDWQPAHAAACWGHLEVLELLVQYNADLNAKNKHDERPADICEDRELKERINQLQQEQEHKRHAQANQMTTQVRRTQSSSNSRTHSVRRTSLRDKELTTKRDAVQEARIRNQTEGGLEVDDKLQMARQKQQHQKQQQHQLNQINGNTNNNNNSSSATKNHSAILPSSPTQVVQQNTHKSLSHNQVVPPTGTTMMPEARRASPEGTENEHTDHMMNSAATTPNNRNIMHEMAPSVPKMEKISPLQSPQHQQQQQVVPFGNNNNNQVSTTTADVNGKVTVVHVVVTINGNGTLADLKKQRQQIRLGGGNVGGNSGPVSSGTIDSGTGSSMVTSSSTFGGAGGGGAADEGGTAIVVGNSGGVMKTKPSDLQRFTGDTDSDVYPPSKPKRCCVIM